MAASPSKSASSPKKSPSKKPSTSIVPSSSSKPAAAKPSYEFGGPIGALLVSILTPLTAYALFYGCSDYAGCPPNWRASDLYIEDVKSVWRKHLLIDGQAWLVYLGWYAFCVAAWAVIPAKEEKGVVMANGARKSYKMNAFPTALMALGLVAGHIMRKGPKGFTYIYDHWPALMTASVVMSVLQSVYVYVQSFKEGKLLAQGGNTGNVIYDWFIGRELNPSIGSFDIKSFNELRPGLILWLLIDISMACKQYQLHGVVTDSMMLVLLFHGWYVLDALYSEAAILTTMDITTDGFGFMLSVGDLTWVPFVYSLQARYLVFNPIWIGLWGIVAIAACQMIGYYIFRTSNNEKNEFRQGNNPKNLTSMQTERGTKLITSGWWGRSRHPNYLGDWIMAFTWSLPTGFGTPITYFYFFFFVILLVHRQRRDDEQCRHKYGKDWDAYCKIVPSRIIPGVY